MEFGEEHFVWREMGGCVQAWQHKQGWYPVPRLFLDISSPVLLLIRWGKAQVAKELGNREV